MHVWNVLHVARWKCRGWGSLVCNQMCPHFDAWSLQYTLCKYKKNLGGQSGSRAEGMKSRWRPRWPPCHKITHNSSTKWATEIILVSLHRFCGSRNLMKPCIWSSPYLVMLKSNIATKRGPRCWTSCNLLSTWSRVTNLVSLPRMSE